MAWRDLSFWISVALVAVVAVVVFKLLAAKVSWAPLQTVAGAI